MKVKRKIISVLLSLLIFTQIFSTCKLNTLATSGVNTFSTQTINGYNCYVYDNPSALPNTFSVYWVYGGKVCTAPASKWLIAALNKKLGTTFTDNWFTDFNTYFMTAIMSATSTVGDFFSGGATRVSNGSSVIGVAFNDLTGKTLENDIPSNANITTPSNCINVTYNILNNYLEDNPQTPPYIILHIFDKNTAQNYIGNSSDNPKWQNDFDSINSISGNYAITSLGKYGSQNYWNLFANTFDNYYFLSNLSDCIFSATTENYNNLVNDFSLTETNYEVSLQELLQYTRNINVNTSNLDGTQKDYNFTLNDSTHAVTNSGTAHSINIYKYWTANNQPYNQTMINVEGQVTIYQSNATPLQIKNNTYNKNFYTSTTYKNYNNSSNNSFNMTYQNVNNSQSTNQTIYNETKTTTNQNIENNNYNVDNSVNDNSTTTIINNYYGDSGGGGDDPTPDPDPDDDDSIWRALLAAIAEFFDKIGELLATILTGIVSLFTDILGAITEITTGFTAITDFLGSVFSWLPAEIIAILTLGLSLGVFICLIKLFK